MRKSLLLGVAVLGLILPQLRTDEPTRRAQEELRKRNLYFGDVDGQMKPELVDALKRYQARKGFDVTGQLDDPTANSLDVPLAALSKSPEQNWPDVPILKSDAARSLSPAEQTEAQEQGGTDGSPAAPTTTPETAARSPDPKEVTRLVEDYLRDAQTADVDLQVRYYGFPVEYFDHGRVDREFVASDTRNYVNRWPKRSYTLLGPVNLSPPDASGLIQVEFTIGFEVVNKKHAVRGKTRNFWTLQPQEGNLRIVAVKEQRLRE